MSTPAEYNTLKEFQELTANKSAPDDFTTLQIDGEDIVNIKWQSGGTASTEKNGAFIEDILAVAYGQLKAYNTSFPSRENSLALTKIEEAVLWLAQRKSEREHRGVYGKEEK